jgi:hypothetical protein
VKDTLNTQDSEKHPLMDTDDEMEEDSEKHPLMDTDDEMDDIPLGVIARIEIAKKSKKPKKKHNKSKQQDHYPSKAPVLPTVIKSTSETVEAVQGSDEIVLLTFQDVKSPLETAGFVFRENLYCRPGMDPKRNSSAVLGQDYFTTEQDFRKNLCAYGLEDCKKWAEDVCLNVSLWIRYSIAESLRSETEILDSPIITGYRAWRLLEQLGFRHVWALLGSDYYYPGVKEKDSVLGTTKFDHEMKFYVYLTRFGLPATCRFDRISSKDRTKLERFLAEKGFVNTL